MKMQYANAAWQDFLQGLTEGPRLYFAPLRPRLWRYVRREARSGWRDAVSAFWRGTELLAERRLDRRGRELRSGPAGCS